ncbi:MAG: hypothetical protein QF893_23735 [Alphaproteobacteria bacterium]|jgi:hypothetical protein|nr:hypothetical protein [Alphaproteobacteria bacterium]
MAHIKDLGRRIELVSMDPHCHDISIGLYERSGPAGGPEFLVHTYSRHEDAAARIDAVTAAMAALGGMAAVDGDARGLRFPCGNEHRAAVKRIFLEACKLAPSADVVARPLTIHDKKSGLEIEAAHAGEGCYRLGAAGEAEGSERRVAAVTRGLMKLAEMQPVADSYDSVAFDCGQAHDALVGLLLGRALNVRAAIREIEEAASRGMLAAPGAQDSGPVSF